MNRRAPAKINLGLVVGPTRDDGKHEIATLLQRIDLRDDVVIEQRDDGQVVVEGFPEDTIVRGALAGLAEHANVASGWHVRLEKRIPVTSGLGGGSTDAAAALELANQGLTSPLSGAALHALAAELGSDVPFFLTEGAQLGTGDGTELTPVSLPLDYAILLVLPAAERKTSTADVYGRFDERRGPDGFETRRAALLEAVDRVREARDLAALPGNDLVSSSFAARLESLGAFRVDVTGAGTVVYALFEDVTDAERAAGVVGDIGKTWVTRPVAT